MLTGVILAGSTHRQVNGKVLELLPFDNETVLMRQIREMEKGCDELIIVTPEPRVYLEHVPRSVRILTDYYPNRGPLGGLHAAFTLSRSSEIWVTGTGMPFVSVDVARLLQEHMNVLSYEAVIPEVKGRIIPLHGLYKKTCLTHVCKLLETGEPDTGWDSLLSRISCGTLNESMLTRELALNSAFSLRIKTQEQYEFALDLGRTV